MRDWQETVQRGLVGEYQSIARIQAKATGDVAFEAGRASILDEMRAGTISFQGLADELRKAGMKKVIEWIKWSRCRDGLMHYCPNCDCGIFGVNESCWQAFLKSNGLGEEARSDD